MSSPFAAHIDKATIQTLLLTSFEGEVIIVDEPSKVQEAVAYLSQFTKFKDSEAVALDILHLSYCVIHNYLN